MLENYPDVLTLKDVREILKVGQNVGLRLLSDGTIKSFKVANKYRVLKSDLIEFISKPWYSWSEGGISMILSVLCQII